MTFNEPAGYEKEKGRKPLVLVAFALEEESISVELPRCNVIQTIIGVGKANAAMNLTAAVLELHPDLIINVGTAGTINHAVGDILVYRRFVDRNLYNLRIHGLIADIDALPCPLFESGSVVGGRRTIGEYTVNTGDNFATDKDGLFGDAIDMEAFACAAVCLKFGLPFVSVKYVTDIVGQNSVKQWSDKLSDARMALHQFFVDYNEKKDQR